MFSSACVVIQALLGIPVVLITGGLSGIGAAVARAFAELGARLVLIDHGRGDPHVTGGDVVVEVADVRDAGQLAGVAARTVDRWGRIDVLVANAGIADQSRLAEGDPERWRAVVETNLLGTIFSIHAVLPQMLAQRSGHIFVTSSVSGREAYPGEAVYIASKWGQVGLSHALRQEVMDHGVRVTLVEPGIVDTPLTRENPVVKPLLEAVEPLASEDVARAIVYAWNQPPHVVVSELTVRPLRQHLPEFDGGH
jgi:NADP-dependent 3-hydroxy acid dehydrogenase YdfG